MVSNLPYEKSKVLLLLLILSAALITPTLIGFKAGRNIPIEGTEYSLNWSGYVAATSEISPDATVTFVNASWTVPTVNSPPKTAYSATWIGIGGSFQGDESLIQVGTAQFIQRGIAYYFAWYELLPASMVVISGVSIEPGDVINASITLTNPSANEWTIELDDLDTPYKDFSLPVTYISSRLSAEWIEEAPSIGRHILRLADFGTVTFTGCYATIGGATASISGFGYHEDIVMVVKYRGTYVPVAIPSDLSVGGTVFTIDYSI